VPSLALRSFTSTRRRALLLSGGGYLALSLFVWWHVWTGHPTSTTTCGCGDSSLFTWFLAWPAYAISHGLDPLYSTYLFHPTGVNLLSNTAEVGIGVVLAPVTWLLGPIATLNVALLLSTFLSALAMFVLVRRWVSWAPAAFISGLLYGFSPFILNALTDAHLMLGFAPIPPLMVACLDEILVRQRRTPLVGGAVLALLIFVQFFIGTEVLALTLIVAGIGIALLLLYGLWHRELLRRRTCHAVRALVIAATATAILLAYPVWFTVAGPAHLSGPVWGPSSYVSYSGTNPRDYVLTSAPSAAGTLLNHAFGGYQAPTLSDQYLGIGLLLVLLIGVILWRPDRRLWLFGTLGVISVLLSYGLHLNEWSLWRLFVRLPEMVNVTPSRFLVITYLCAAVMLGIIVDHVYTGANRWWRAGRPLSDHTSTDGRRLGGPVAALVVAAIALVPIASFYFGGLPLTTQPVVLPTWFRTVAPHLAGKQVVLAFPAFALFETTMIWQAVDGMSYSMVGGGGPALLLQRAGTEASGQMAISHIAFTTRPQNTPQAVAAVRHALVGWGVTMIVLPDQPNLPPYERAPHLITTVALLTAATGQRPIHQADAWVWSKLSHAHS
jgi:hypothetical protein